MEEKFSILIVIYIFNKYYKSCCRTFFSVKSRLESNNERAANLLYSFLNKQAFELLLE